MIKNTIIYEQYYGTKLLQSNYKDFDMYYSLKSNIFRFVLIVYYINSIIFSKNSVYIISVYIIQLATNTYVNVHIG